MCRYVSIEDVQKIPSILYEKYSIDIWKQYTDLLLKEINSLSSINPESMIEEMIEKVLKSDDPYELELPDYRNNPTASLQELLQKFKS